MKQTENAAEREPLTLTDVPDAELDRALADLAEDVPEVPGDFHDRWMEAVRAETKKKPPVPWTRILSTAAVVAVVFGGAVLLRGNREPSSMNHEPLYSASEKAAEEETHEQPAMDSEPLSGVSEEEAAVSEPEPENSRKASGAEPPALNGMAAGMLPASTGAPTGEPPPAKAALMAAEASGPAYEAADEAPDAFRDEAAEEEEAPSMRGLAEAVAEALRAGAARVIREITRNMPAGN